MGSEVPQDNRTHLDVARFDRLANNRSFLLGRHLAGDEDLGRNGLGRVATAAGGSRQRRRVLLRSSLCPTHPPLDIAVHSLQPA